MNHRCSATLDRIYTECIFKSGGFVITLSSPYCSDQDSDKRWCSDITTVTLLPETTKTATPACCFTLLQLILTRSPSMSGAMVPRQGRHLCRPAYINFSFARATPLSWNTDLRYHVANAFRAIKPIRLYWIPQSQTYSWDMRTTYI